MSVLMQETLVSISSETTISSHIPTLCHQHNASALGYADSLNNLFVEKLDMVILNKNETLYRTAILYKIYYFLS